jgi:MFS family permease
MNKRNNNLVTPRIRRARIATFAGFMMIGAMMYIWSTGVTAFREQMGLSGSLGDVDFGMIALSIGVGAAIGCIAVGRFVDAFGARKVIYATAIAYPLSIIPMGYVSHFWFAVTFGGVLGLFRGAIDTALNSHGVQVERFYQRPIMSAFHAFYSFGGFLIGIVGSYLASNYTSSAAVPFTVLGLAMLLIGLVTGHFLLDKGEAPAQDMAVAVSDAAGPASSARNWQIILIMVGFGVLLLGSIIGEGAVSDWGQEYVRRQLGTSASEAGLAISVFIGAQCFSRVVGDRIAERIGAAQMVFCSGLVAVAGLLVTIIGGTPLAGLIGFGLYGLGLACIAPLMLSSAGRKDPAHAGRNIGIVNGIGYSGMLVGPAGIAAVVNYFGLSYLLYAPLILLSVLAIFSPLLMRAHVSSPAGSGASSSLPAH